MLFPGVFFMMPVRPVLLSRKRHFKEQGYLSVSFAPGGRSQQQSLYFGYHGGTGCLFYADAGDMPVFIYVKSGFYRYRFILTNGLVVVIPEKLPELFLSKR